MKFASLLCTALFLFCVSALAQKISEPKFLGELIANGDDLSEFFAHRVLDQAYFALEESGGEGRLIVRVCGSGEFSDVLVKSPVNPVAEMLIGYGLRVPDEKIFVAKSSKCGKTTSMIFNQYWFVPEKSKFEYDEIFPAKNISYRIFDVKDYDYERSRFRRTNVEEKEFSENITKFIAELKSNSEAQGFIVYNSKNKKIKRNIEQTKARLEKENISLQRVKTIIKRSLWYAGDDKISEIRDEKRYFPRLEVVAIKK